MSTGDISLENQHGSSTIDPDAIESRLSKIVKSVRDCATPGEQIEAYALWSRDNEIRSFRCEIETLESAESEGIGIRVIKDGKLGFAWSGRTDEKSIRDTLENARDNTQYATPDEAVGLAIPDGVKPADLNLFREELLEVPMAEKVAMAIDLDRELQSRDKRIRLVEQANYGDGAFISAIATTEGIQLSSRRTSCYLAAYALAGEGEDSHAGGGSHVARSVEELDKEIVVSEAVVHATRLLGAKKPTSRDLTVVFEPRVCATFLSIIS
ncbi:MAG: hypothetical protein HKL80_04310, partial [Acidimicrobiales bacterium]|nr:hypothetical protein [Acidimicrobiales bacterium]